MSLQIPGRLAGLACLLLLAHAAPAPAAESFDNCAGFIDAVPVTITTQGVWCMRGDLATNLASGNAITVSTNNVTIACNDYKLGNLAAGEGNGATGISAFLRLNTTVRGCNVRGFYVGIGLIGSGHVIEDNRVEASGLYGIQLSGEGSVARRNRVFDTGNPTIGAAAAIYTGATTDLEDNIVSGVSTVPGSGVGVMGIFVDASVGGRVKGNVVRGLVADGDGTNYGIFINNNGGGVSIIDNQVVNGSAPSGSAVQCAGLPASIASGNHSLGFPTVLGGCTDGGGNLGN